MISSENANAQGCVADSDLGYRLGVGTGLKTTSCEFAFSMMQRNSLLWVRFLAI